MSCWRKFLKKNTMVLTNAIYTFIQLYYFIEYLDFLCKIYHPKPYLVIIELIIYTPIVKNLLYIKHYYKTQEEDNY